MHNSAVDTDPIKCRSVQLAELLSYCDALGGSSDPEEHL